MASAANNGLPAFITFDAGEREESDVFFIRSESGEFDPRDAATQQGFNRAILESLRSLDSLRLRPPVLLKVHVGEPRCRTNIRPVFSAGSISFLSEKGVGNFFFGDSTVLHPGPRGHSGNDSRAGPYIQLARKQGWGLVAPFVVLDRPATSVPGKVEFSQEEWIRELDVGGRFSRFSLSGGFAACGTVINNAHLTLHKLSHFALCVKGLALGLSGHTGKLVMHQCYHPVVDDEACNQCGTCIENCQDNAIREGEDGEPILDKQKCIGCGDCAADCPDLSITMTGSEVANWSKGRSSFSFRMVDYLMGLMSGHWDGLVNIAHLYNITKLCDCVDEAQKPICENIGFLVGMNPFAVDCAAKEILQQWLVESGIKKGIRHFYPADDGEAMFDYARGKYGVITRPRLIPVDVRV